jgi:hypothetical protein
MNTRPPSALDEFVQVQGTVKPPGMLGWWETVIPELTDEQADALGQAGRDRSISHRTISIVLDRWGHRVSPAQVGHWRRNVVR